MTSLVGKATNVAKLGSVRALSTSTEMQKERRVGQIDLKGQTSLAYLKKGTGYRSSFSGMVATVFGANGMVGRGVCNRLGKIGSQMILPYRGEHYHFMRMKVYGDLGQVLFTPFHLKDEDSIRKAMKHSNVVINLIGKEWGTRNFSLEDVHIRGPAMLARIARESGVERFIHISHLNARETPQRFFMPTGSEYLRTKWKGEEAVFKEFPNATIFRPSDMYGPLDKFVNYYLDKNRYGWHHNLPLWGKGENIIKTPLFFSDLASGIVNALADPSSKGEVYEAYGPESFRLSVLMDWMNAMCRRWDDWNYKRTELLLSPYVFLKCFVNQNLPVGTQHYGNATLERLERSCMNDEILGLPSLYDLGVKPGKVEEHINEHLLMHVIDAAWKPETPEEVPYVPPLTPLGRLEEKELRSKGKMSFLQSVGLA